MGVFLYNLYMSRKPNTPKGTNLEYKIENYLEHNLHLIEDGLKLVRRQYKVYYKSKTYLGAIDLFCQGEDGAQVIVELKSGELNSHNLGQIMSYYMVCKKRADLYNLLPPRVYCIGYSIGPQYKLGLELLNGGELMNLTPQIYEISLTSKISDKEFEVKLYNYNMCDEGSLTIKL